MTASSPTASTPATTVPRTSVYIEHADAEVLRDLASELGLIQMSGGGKRFEAGSLSALMRFLAAASMTPHRPQIVQFLRALQAVAVPTTTVQ